MFAITKDHGFDPEFDNESRVGVFGPDGCPLSYDEIVNHEHGQPFRMLTDDDELIYEGVFVDSPGTFDEFEPLDCFGMADYGCTKIQYKEGNAWVQP